MEQCWNDTDSEKPKYSQTKPVSVSFIQHQPHVDWSEIKPTQDENVQFCHCKTVSLSPRNHVLLSDIYEIN